MEGKKSIQIKEDFDNNDPEAYLKIYNLLMKKGGDKILYQIKK